MSDILLVLYLGLNTVYFIYAKRQKCRKEDKDDILFILGKPIVDRLSFDTVKKLVTEKSIYKLRKLYAVKKQEEGIRHYQSVRIGLMYILLILGGLFAIILGSQYESEKVMSYEIERPKYGEDAISYNLAYSVERGDELLEGSIPVEVKPQLPSEDEAIKIIESKFAELERLITYNNENHERIYQNLYLLEAPFDEPILIEYVSLTPEFLTNDGQLRRNLMLKEEATPISLMATLSIGDTVMSYTYDFNAYLEDITYNDEFNLITENIKVNEESVALPKKLMNNGLKINWSEQEEGIPGYKIILVAILIAILLYTVKQSDIDKAIEKRAEEILYDFPDVINKLTMLINAGMTFSRAWSKIVSDYQKKNSKKRVLYEEMSSVIQDINNGVPETEAIETFGRRTQNKEVIRLSAILIQNLKRGGNSMTEALKELSREAWEIRTATAKKLGEKASTKLLIPMAISLFTVIIIVITPTFMQMNT